LQFFTSLWLWPPTHFYKLKKSIKIFVDRKNTVVYTNATFSFNRLTCTITCCIIKYNQPSGFPTFFVPKRFFPKRRRSTFFSVTHVIWTFYCKVKVYDRIYFVLKTFDAIFEGSLKLYLKIPLLIIVSACYLILFCFLSWNKVICSTFL
jgi:hypothetical protein